jgi:hypothetical protein
MTQRGYLIDSPIPALSKSIEAGRLCAYSVTRQRFLCAEVETDDFSESALDNQLLTPFHDSAKALWLCPFFNIPPTSLSAPVDLIHLDWNFIVLETVESFPLFRATGSAPPAASVLVLPADSVRSTGTQRGDQLILCLPSEMKRRLAELSGAGGKTQPNVAEPAVDESPERTNTARVLRWEDRSGAKSSTGKTSVDEQLPNRQSHFLKGLFVKGNAAGAPRTRSAKAERTASSTGGADSFKLLKAIQPAIANDKPAKSWLQKFLSPDPPEPRKSARESIEGLVAYFFTGGPPMPHPIRDISENGVFVYTQERWYPGTMVRVTLADSLEKSCARSITLNMLVVRANDDGVGLSFVLENPNGRNQRIQGMLTGAGSLEVQRFLQQLRDTRA